MLQRAVILALAGDSRPLRSRLASAGLDVTVLDTPDPAVTDAAVLAAAGRHPDAAWLDARTGWTLTRWEAARALAHEAAWHAVAAGRGDALVVEAHVALGEGWLRAVTEVLAGLDDAWDVLHLDADRLGAAYAVTPVAAARLLETVGAAVLPVTAVVEETPVDAYAVDPPVAQVTAHDPGEPIVDHLHVIEAASVAEVVTALEPLPAEHVALVLPAGRSRVLVPAAGVLEAHAAVGAEPRAIDDGALGPVAAVAGWAATGGGRGVLPPDDGTLFHTAPPADASTLLLNGRLTNAATGANPVALVVADRALAADFDAARADAGTRDLARILRYDDAVVPIDGWTEVAPDLVQLPFWTPAFCATVIRAAEAVGAFVPHDDDPVPGHEVSLAAISPRLYAHLEDDLAVRVLPALQQVWPFVEYAGLRDAFVIKYTASGQTELRMHHDVAQLSGSVRLNEGYAGGLLEFPRQQWHNGQLPVGHLIVWPSLVTHPHRSTPLQQGIKYGLTIWFELPGHT